MNNLVVSICMITYNHEKYIRGAIEGVLMQEVDFSWELIIADDFSTDKTRAIVLEYQEKNPDRIKIIFQKKNVGPVLNWWDLITSPKGKYVALCDGDDFWTDPLKLQKQVDFLDQNNEYGLVCGGFKLKNQQTGTESEWLVKDVPTSSKHPNGFDITPEVFWNNWCIQTLTVMYRNELFDPVEFENFNYNYPIDLHLYYYLFIQQKAFYFKENYGIQNVTEQGVYSNKPILVKLKVLYFARKELFIRYKNDQLLKAKFFNVTSELFVSKEYVKEQKDLNRRSLFKDMLRSMQTVNDFKHLLICVFAPKKISKS